MTNRATQFRHHVSPQESGVSAKRLGIALAGAVLASTLTAGCTCPLLSILAPSPAVTPTPTKTPRPSVTPTSTWSPTPQATATETLAPTETPTIAPTDTPTSAPIPPTPTRRAPTATATRRPASPTPPRPTATATVSYQYSLHQTVGYLPDCEATTLEGTVWDVDPSKQVGGVLLKVCIEGEYWCNQSPIVTGQDPTKGEGYYAAILDSEKPKAGNWWVAVVDAQGRPLSQAIRFQTDTQDCDPDGTGRQWVEINFKKNY